MILASSLQIITKKILHLNAGARALMYHSFGYRKQDPFCITPEEFERQIKWVSHNKNVLSVKEFEQLLENKESIPKNSLLITIDDGYKSTLEIAQPILKKYNLPAILYVSSGIFDNTLENNPEFEPHMNKKELQSLFNEGMEIGSHGHSHCFLKGLSGSKLKKEIIDSKSELEKIIKSKITSFAYPYGTKAAFDENTIFATKIANYKSSFTAQHGVIKKNTDRYELPRIKIESGESLFFFKLICNGGIDNWRIIDNLLSKIQKPIY